jgi:hypothetical protein
MQRIVCVLSLVLGIGVVLGLAAGQAAASPPPPSYGQATLTVESCNFTADVTWAHTKVDSVLFTLHVQGSVSESEDTVTPKGRKAVTTFALGTDPTTRTFYVTAALSLNGTVVDTETSSSVDAGCAFLL